MFDEFISPLRGLIVFACGDPGASLSRSRSFAMPLAFSSRPFGALMTSETSSPPLINGGASGGKSFADARGRRAAGLRLRRECSFERKRLVHVLRDERREPAKLFEFEFVKLKTFPNAVEHHPTDGLVGLAERKAAAD